MAEIFVLNLVNALMRSNVKGEYMKLMLKVEELRDIIKFAENRCIQDVSACRMLDEMKVIVRECNYFIDKGPNFFKRKYTKEKIQLSIKEINRLMSRFSYSLESLERMEEVVPLPVKLMQLLMEPNEVECCVLAIVGMGGIGKTTLARRLYNDNRIESHFGMNIWVCVSQVFEEIDILKQIIDQAAQSKEEGLYAKLEAAQTKEELYSLMRVVLGRRRFLLVLDDLWSNQIWEDCLRIPFTRFTAASSRVLITTRSEQLTRQMGAIYTHVMKGSEECSSPVILESELLTVGKIAQEEFTEAAWQAILSSHGKGTMHQITQTAHLMKALLEQNNDDARQIFSKAGVDNTRLLEATNQYIQRQLNAVGEASGSKEGTSLEELIKRARKFRKYGDPLVSVGHLLLAFTGDLSFGVQLFNNLKISFNILKSAIRQDLKALDRYGKDLTAMAEAGEIDPIIGRGAEIDSCMDILLMKRNGNPVIIGHPGVGKTAIVKGLAQRMVEGAVPEGLQNCKIAQEEFTEAAWQAILSSHGKGMTHQITKTAHLMKALLEQKNGDACEIFSKAGVDNTGLLEATNQYIQRQLNAVGEASGSKQGTSLEELIKRARKFRKYGDPLVSVGHLLLAFTGDLSFGVQLFNNFKITFNILKSAIRQDLKALDRYGMDLTAKAEDGEIDPIIGRDAEIESCMEILLMKRNGNPVLLGDPGVGKTAIVEGLAQRIVEGTVPQGLQNCKLISLDIGALNSGTKNRGDLENRLKDVLGEVTQSDGHTIIFIDEIHMIVGAGDPNGTMDVSNLLKPELDRGKLHCIGATTIAEFRKHIEKDPALKRRFQPVNVKEATVEDTISILRGLREKYEHHHGVRISDNALVDAARLSNCYIREGFLPNKAIVLVDRTAARLKMELISKPTILDEMECFSLAIDTYKASMNSLNDIEIKLSSMQDGLTVQLGLEKSLVTHIQNINEVIQQEENKLHDYQNSTGNYMLRGEVTSNDIAEILSKQTGIPMTKLLQSEKEKLLKLEEELHKQIIGQDSAVKSVAMAIKRSRVGLSDPHRPIASLMFMGPTGVGKTELAKTLALYMFNTEEALVRFDMSEYIDKHTVSRLIGAPPGYISCENGGQLTEKVRERPYSVILFDEIEKAHSDVLNVFLHILDDGRVTDSLGRTVSFTNTIIIMTTNVGSKDILINAIDYETIKQKVMLAAKSVFKPEFWNRVDEWIIFHPLDHKQINIIVQLQLKKLQERMSNQKIKIRATEAAVELLGNFGYDRNYGARSVKRIIEQMVVNEITDLLLKDEFKNEDTILIDVEGTTSSIHQLSQQKLTFRKLNLDTGPHSEDE